MVTELTINALVALVRRGWTVTMQDGEVLYELPPLSGVYQGDWIAIPAEVAETLGRDG